MAHARGTAGLLPSGQETAHEGQGAKERNVPEAKGGSGPSAQKTRLRSRRREPGLCIQDKV